MSFGADYIIPKPVDPRLLSTVAPAVAKAAMESGVAKKTISNWDAYKVELNKRLGLDNQLLRAIGNKARRDPKRLVFAEADNLKILKAASFMGSLICVALTSKAPLKMYGKPKTLFTWLG